MRSFLILVLIAGVACFVTFQARHRNAINTIWMQDMPAMPPQVVVRSSMPRINIQKTTFKKTKRAPNQETAYAFAVEGWAPTVEEAKKDALEQATKVVTAAMELQHTPV